MSTPYSSEMYFILLSVVGIHTPPRLAHGRQGAISPDSLLPAMFPTSLELEPETTHTQDKEGHWEKVQCKDCYYVPLRRKSLTHPPHSEQAGTTIQVLGVGGFTSFLFVYKCCLTFFYSLLNQTHLSFLII